MSKSIDNSQISVDWYINNRPIYKKLAIKIQTILTEIFEMKKLSYHIITCRAKEIDSFKIKIANPKYNDPINQITDLAGIRIISYVEDELVQICKILEETFDIDKNNSLDKSKELGIDKVGYKSVHYVAKLKNDRLQLPEYSIYENKFFEIQVRTILQHAWAEIEHDRNYKFSGKLPDEISRRFKLLAGSLEIADREFNHISQEIDKIAKDVKEGTEKGTLNFDLNTTSLRQYIETKFKDLGGIDQLKIVNIDEAINELDKFGIKSLADFDKLVPKDFVEVFNSSGKTISSIGSIAGIIRAILIISDQDKYFLNSWDKSWTIWNPEVTGYSKTFDYYKVNWSDIEQKYKVTLEPKNSA